MRFKFKEGSWDYSLGIKVKEGKYNANNKEVKDDLESTIRLNNILQVVKRIKLSMFSEGAGYIPRDAFKERFLETLQTKKLVYVEKIDHTGKAIMYISDYIEEYLSTGEKTSRIKRSTSTTYNRLLKKVKGFDSRWDISSTDQTKLKSFRLFMINQGLATSTINLMLVRLKTILKNYNRYDGDLSSKILDSQNLDKMKETKKKWVYITLDELDTIYNMDIKDPQLTKARDLLLIGCFTALRVSDWEIKPSDISEDKNKLTYRTQKTGAIVEIPLFKKLKAVLERNGWATPILHESQINPLFKEICRMAGMTRSFKSYNIYPDRTEEVIHQAWEGVTSHTCRRSFATNMYLGEMSVSQIRVFTGHASDKVFMNYVQASETEISQQIKLDSLEKIFNNE